MPFLEGLQDRDEGAGLGLVPLEAVHLQREAGGVDHEPDLDLRVDPAFLAHPDLAELVLVLNLEVQRRAVIKDQRHLPSRRLGRMRQAGRRHAAAVVPVDAAGQRPEHRAQRRTLDADIAQHPQRVGLRGGLDDPPQHQVLERLITDDVEAEPVIGLSQHIPQQQRGRPDHPAASHQRSTATPVGGRRSSQRQLSGRCPRPVRHIVDGDPGLLQQTEVEFALPPMQPLPSCPQQQRQVCVGVRRADVIELHDLAVSLGHDLNSHRP